LPKEIDSIELYNECNNRGLAIVPGKVFFLDNSLYSNYIRLSFGSVNNENIIEGIKLLKDILSKNIKGRNNDYLPFI